MEIKEIVFKTLKDAREPLKSGDIAEKCGQDKAAVDKAIKALVKEERIDSPKRCFYQAK
ncbi:MAG: MarR family transcriptional regulator [Bacteroidales bacterium]|jgi:predicted transcriptional regulator|nr:MarR family transcriptional regulator [Bacteroidales bacterium]